MHDERDAQPTVPDYASAPGAPRPDGPHAGLAPGTLIGQVWQVEKMLGNGGMGSVYRCHNRHAPRILAAIKLLDPAFQYHPEAKARFLREAEILYTVDHPNVVKVSNVHLDASPPYLEMEFVDGLALEDELARFGQLPMEVALDRAKQLASALKYLHRKNIFHRDVKPQNILTRKDGTLKLVDFGLAVERGGERITQQETVNFGTVSYCPPEWGRPVAVDPASWDLYALGVVLYEMLTGTVAFPVASQADPRRQMLQVMSDKQRVEALDPGPRFEPHLREVVRRLTSKEPANRYADAKALLAALDEVDIGWRSEPGVSRAPVRVTTREDAARRSGMLGALGFVGAVAGAGLAVGVVVAVAVLAAIGFAPRTRDAELFVGGVAAGVPVSLRVADQPPSSIVGARHRFLRLPVGEVEVAWAVGEGCDAPCDAGCPAWCTSGRASLAIEEGEGPAALALEVAGPAPRAVEVVAPEVSAGFARLGDRQVAFAAGIARFEGVTPGRYRLLAAAGDCPAACDVDCGPRCAVVRQDALVVPARTGDHLVALDLVAPAPTPAPAAVRPSPQPAPTLGRGRVSRGEYAAWLASHPEWARDAAIEAGRATRDYLAGWVEGAPPDPASAAVTNVPWAAAAAFCGSRGLARIDDEPTRWDDLPMMEWRVGEAGERRWRRMDGGVSLKRVEAESNSGTTFRCR